MIDASPLCHAIAVLSLQCVGGICFGMWGIGGVFGCIFFLAREHTQAEYRWISQFGAGKRAAMPWWGGFDYRVWNAGSLLDWLAPVLMSSLLYFVISYLHLS